ASAWSRWRSTTGFVKPLRDEPTNLLILCERQRASVAFPRVVIAAEPTKHIGLSKVEGRVVFQDSAALHAIEQIESRACAYREEVGSRRFRLEAGGRFVAREWVDQDGNLAQTRPRRGGCFGVPCRDRAWDLIRARSPQAKGLLDEPYPFLDLGA